MLKLLPFPSKVEISNKEFGDYVIKFLGNAKSNVFWITSLHNGFHNTEKMEKAINDTIDRDISFHFILANSPPIKEIDWFYELFNNRKILVRKFNEERPHIIIVDGNHIRLESEHGYDDIYEASNTIIYNTLFAKHQEREFLKLWTKSKKIARVKAKKAKSKKIVS